MYTEHDERQGLVKTHWAHVRDRVHKVNPEFATLVDEIDPGKELPLFLAYYRYGDHKGDTISPIMPKMNGGCYRLLENEAPKEVFRHLGYGSAFVPLAIALEKKFELHMNLKNKKITIPIIIYKPGDIFPFHIILKATQTRNYAPNGILETTSGCRSVFMLPYIGCMIQHCNLQRDFNTRIPVTKSTYEHWALFKELANHEALKSNWKSCLLYFSESWINNIINNPVWYKVKLFMYQYFWQTTEFRRNYFYYDFIFSMLQENINLKPNPYLIDTAKHLFKIAMGEAAGFEPCVDEEALPLNILQKIFVESYGLKKYTPTIMNPEYFSLQKRLPIYYSLQHPTTDVFSPKSREDNSALHDLRELSRVLKKLKTDLSDSKGLCADTVMYQIANSIDFNYFHNKEDEHRIIKLSSDVIKQDNRFNITQRQGETAKLSSDGKFFRGCISISGT